MAGKSLKKGSSAKVDFAADDDDYNDVHGQYAGKEKKSKRLNKSRDEMIDSDDSDSYLDEREYSDDEKDMSSSDDESKRETVDEKRSRLAREYLNKVEQATKDDEDSSSFVSSDQDSHVSDDRGENRLHEKISKRLSRERLKKEGRLGVQIASTVKQAVDDIWMRLGTESMELVKDQAQSWIDNHFVTQMRGHDLSPTCVALHMPTGDLAYSGSKDGSVFMWDIERECRLNTIVPQWKKNSVTQDRKSSEVLSIACSDDGRYLAVGGRDSKVKIYDIRLAGKGVKDAANENPHDTYTCGLISTFEGHKRPVTTLAFRSQSLQLFSGSDDRCIRHYNLSELSYVETLYGHQAAVTGITCCTKELPFSVGRDRTARAWKLNEESHLIFRGGSKTPSADCITALNDDFFLTGHDDGALNLWCKDRKKPISSVASCHGQFDSGIPRGIVCCSSLGYSDIAVTGSNDGYVRYWRVSLRIHFVL